MSVKYLGKQRPDPNITSIPCSQMVNVPELAGGQRCPFCKYKVLPRNTQQYAACIRKNRCGQESILFAGLNNLWSYTGLHREHYSPTGIYKQHTIGYDKRYLQLYSCDIEGYQCSSLCQFYPARIEEGKTIAACSETNGCGRNGSFWTLLTIANEMLLTVPKYSEFADSATKIMLLDGTIIDDDHIVSVGLDGSSVVKAFSAGGNTYNIVMMQESCAFCGALLVARTDNAATWYWSATDVFNDTYKHTCVFINNNHDAIRTLLINAGFPSAALGTPLFAVYPCTWTNGTTYYVRVWTSSLSNILGPAHRFLVVQTVAPTKNFIIQVGAASNKYLVVPRTGFTPSQVKVAKTTEELPAGYDVYTISRYSDPMRYALTGIGVRDSIFQNLP